MHLQKPHIKCGASFFLKFVIKSTDKNEKSNSYCYRSNRFNWLEPG